MTRTRINAKGQVIQSNYGITQTGPTSFKCDGCGKPFHRYGKGGIKVYSDATDGARADNLNRARAQRHADTCKGA